MGCLSYVAVCSWITQAITKGSGCQISKPCFRKCFEPQVCVHTHPACMPRAALLSSRMQVLQPLTRPVLPR